MFETEAEEYAKKRAKELWINECNLAYAAMERAFQKGAKFGYNKANEWHKQEVDDIYDLIAEDWSIKYFICIMKDKSRVSAMGCCDEGWSGEVSVNLFFDHDDEKYHLDDIVWWKEIVLPKEIE